MIPFEVKFAAFLLALVGAVWWGHHTAATSCRAQADELRADQVGSLAKAYEDQVLERQKKDTAYEQELSTLRNQQSALPVIPVRLCPSAPRPVVSQTASKGQVLPPGAGVLPKAPDANPDIGATLFAGADYADAIVAKCRAD